MYSAKVPEGHDAQRPGWDWTNERKSLYANYLSYEEHLIAVKAIRAEKSQSRDRRRSECPHHFPLS